MIRTPRIGLAGFAVLALAQLLPAPTGTAPAPLFAQTPVPPAPERVDLPSPLFARSTEPPARELAALLKPNAPPDSSHVQRALDRWHGDSGGPNTGADQLALARIWERAGVVRPAAEALSRARDRVPWPAWHLQMARVGFLSGDTALAVREYWRSCRGAGAQAASGLWRDLSALATPEERAEWEEVSRGVPREGARCAYLRRFWGVRASRAGMSVSDRLATHYARLRYARRVYARVAGMRDRLGSGDLPLSRRIGRPPEAPFDDRGLIYLRLGAPDRKASFGGSVESRLISPGCFAPNESWAYDFPSGTRVYHLSPIGGVADWWLIDNLSDVYLCGDPDRFQSVAVTSTGSFVTSQAVVDPLFPGTTPQIGRIAYLVLPDLYLSRQGVDPRYARMSYRLRDPSPDTAADRDRVKPPTLKQGVDGLGEAAEAEDQLMEERTLTWKDGRFALDSVPDRPAVKPRIRLRYESLQSRRGGSTRVWLNGVAEAEGLTPDSLADGRFGYQVVASISLLDEQGTQSRASRPFRAVTHHRLGKGEGIPFRLPIDVAPGSYEYTVVLRDANDREGVPAGNYDWGTVKVRPLAGDIPELSDIAVAPDSGGSWSPGASVYLRANPAHVTNARGIAFLYYEAYGLTPGGESVTTVELRPKKGGGEPFELRYPGQAPDEGEPERRLLRLDLSGTKPGPYVAQIRVRDETTGVETLPIEVHISVERR